MQKEMVVRYVGGLLQNLDREQLHYAEKADYILRKLAEIGMVEFNDPVLSEAIMVNESEAEAYKRKKSTI